MAIRGRKPVAGKTRDKYLRVRVSEDEKRKIELAAETVDLNSSDYVRDVVSRDVKRKKIR